MSQLIEFNSDQQELLDIFDHDQIIQNYLNKTYSDRPTLLITKILKCIIWLILFKSDISVNFRNIRRKTLQEKNTPSDYEQFAQIFYEKQYNKPIIFSKKDLQQVLIWEVRVGKKPTHKPIYLIDKILENIKKKLI